MSYWASIECDDAEVLAEARAAKLARRAYCDVWGEHGHNYYSEDTGERVDYCQCGALDREDDRVPLYKYDPNDPENEPPF